jgi:hemolysin activation/secretion protein
LRSKVAGSIIEGNSLVRNDLYRLGGLHSIRGFNEKSLFATSFVYANIELRAPLSNDSYIMCFYDQGIVSDRLSGNCTPDWPFGTGLGISLETDVGMFNFILGMGQSKNQSLGFGQSKIHFGYSGRF